MRELGLLVEGEAVRARAAIDREHLFVGSERSMIASTSAPASTSIAVYATLSKFSATPFTVTRIVARYFQ